MNFFFYLNFILFFCFITNIYGFANCKFKSNLTSEPLTCFSKGIIPQLEGSRKSDAGRILIIGGSGDFVGASYFSAISSLKTGADMAFVLTTEDAAPIVKAYSPDLIVFPYLNTNNTSKVNNILQSKHVIVIGPGLGRLPETMKLFYDIIENCKKLRKPLVIDADGLFAISKNVNVIKDYPKPGVILTPNAKEALHLKLATTNSSHWTDYWGEYISVLVKGQNDQFYSRIPTFNWVISEGGSGRRVVGQGDILAGSMGTFLNWALTSIPPCYEHHVRLGHSVAAYAAAKLTRACNRASFTSLGRSMLASDMLKEFKPAFDELFS